MENDSDKAAWPLLYAAAKELTGRRPARSRRDHLFTKYHIGVLEAILARLQLHGVIFDVSEGSCKAVREMGFRAAQQALMQAQLPPNPS